MRGLFGVEELRDAELAGPFDFTKGCRLLRTSGKPWGGAEAPETLLFDLESDPKQEKPIHDPAAEKKMIGHLLRLMEQHDAPPGEYERLGLPRRGR
jgi:hypothetical protein